MYRQTPSHRNQQQDNNLRPPKMPDRPLVPYMRFSKKMWPKVRAENPDSPLWDLGKLIGQMWNSTSPAEKAIYQQEYEADKVEYEKAMKNYNATYSQFMATKSRVKTSQQEKMVGGRKGGTAEQNAVTGVFIQPVEDENPFEMAGKRLAAIRYDRNNRLMAELFSSNYMPDPRTFVPQQRIEHFRKQGQSLEQHQNKLNDELAKLEEQFSQRKRAIEEASEAYAENMKKVCLEKPSQIDQQSHLNKIAEEYGEQLLTNWIQYKEKQTALEAKLEAEKLANPILSELITGKSPTNPQDKPMTTTGDANTTDQLNKNDGTKIETEGGISQSEDQQSPMDDQITKEGEDNSMLPSRNNN